MCIVGFNVDDLSLFWKVYFETGVVVYVSKQIAYWLIECVC